jgi:hypothetical protein
VQGEARVITRLPKQAQDAASITPSLEVEITTTESAEATEVPTETRFATEEPAATLVPTDTELPTETTEAASTIPATETAAAQVQSIEESPTEIVEAGIGCPWTATPAPTETSIPTVVPAPTDTPVLAEPSATTGDAVGGVTTPGSGSGTDGYVGTPAQLPDTGAGKVTIQRGGQGWIYLAVIVTAALALCTWRKTRHGSR